MFSLKVELSLNLASYWQFCVQVPHRESHSHPSLIFKGKLGSGVSKSLHSDWLKICCAVSWCSCHIKLLAT